jgi:hypothetical protein
MQQHTALCRIDPTVSKGGLYLFLYKNSDKVKLLSARPPEVVERGVQFEVAALISTKTANGVSAHLRRGIAETLTFLTNARAYTGPGNVDRCGS